MWWLHYSTNKYFLNIVPTISSDWPFRKLLRNCSNNSNNIQWCLFSPAGSIAALRLTEVRIPNHTVRGSTARLECHYEMDGEALYSVKWYKDGNEFYRYVPRDMPPVLIFQLPGVSVDVSCWIFNDINSIYHRSDTSQWGSIAKINSHQEIASKFFAWKQPHSHSLSTYIFNVVYVILRFLFTFEKSQISDYLHFSFNEVI